MQTQTDSATVATAIGDALKSAALSEAVFDFGETQIILTKTQRVTGEPLDADDAPPSYPVVQTKLTDDSESWLS